MIVFDHVSKVYPNGTVSYTHLTHLRRIPQRKPQQRAAATVQRLGGDDADGRL